MAHTSTSQCLLGLARSFRRLNASDPLTQCLAPSLCHTFATATQSSLVDAAQGIPIEAQQPPSSTSISPSASPANVLTTLYSWPTLEPVRFAHYSSQQLGLPLRRDILHRAVIYEADNHRGWSTASTKWRKDVHGGNRKIAPQKGLGRARVGDKKSPIRRGGGVAFGPHPRDFSSDLPRKIYDIAWRTALSYRYRRGELVVLDDEISMDLGASPWWLENVFLEHKWGHEHGRSLLVSDRIKDEEIYSQEDEDKAEMQEVLWGTMKKVHTHGLIKDLEDVDVKDLLETGRVVIDKYSLDKLLLRHQSDMKTKIKQVC